LRAFDGNQDITGTSTDWGQLLFNPTFFSFFLELTDPTDGNPFDGIGQTNIDVYAAGLGSMFGVPGERNLVYSYVKGNGGYDNNYMNFNGFGLSAIDNLSIERMGSVTFAENGTDVVYRATAIDPDLGTTLTYSLGGTDSNLFNIDQTGAITFKNAPNYESPTDSGGNNVYDLVVLVNDGVFPFDFEQQVTVRVTDVTTAIALTNLVSEIDENTSTTSRVKVADIALTTDTEITNTISVIGTDAASFEADATGLYFKAGTILDFESKSNYSVTVQLNSSDGSINTKAFAIAVTDVNEAPTAVSLNNQVTAISENTSTATRIKVADIAITDDGLGTNNLSVSGTDASFFEVDATGLYVKADTVLNFETKTSYSVTVNVDDSTVGATPDAIATYSLSVTDINENPSVFGFSAPTYRVIEDGTTTTPITINRTDNTTGTASVTVNLSGGTATATTDYNNSPITINFADGETSKTVVVPIVLDSINEPVETVNLSLTNPTGAAYGATVGGNTSSVLSIIDFYNRSTSTQDETIVAPSGSSVVNASTGTGNDTIDLNLNNRTGNAVVSAGMGNDSIFAGAGNDLLDGGGGDDKIFGGAGADRLVGGAGVDRLYGGLGNDRLTGGLGNDIFALEAASGTDLILDFQTGDRFGLTGSLTFGSLSFVASGVNTNITNSGNVLAIVTGVAPSAINVSTNFVPLPLV
jgi:Ca2+-binding RTX toxin-like protein